MRWKRKKKGKIGNSLPGDEEREGRGGVAGLAVGVERKARE